jgi:myo-inositol catabolism protein IolC
MSLSDMAALHILKGLAVGISIYSENSKKGTRMWLLEWTASPSAAIASVSCTFRKKKIYLRS